MRSYPHRDETSGKAFVKAISHPLRSKLILTLSTKRATAAELAEETGAPVRTVRHHLRYLSERGFVTITREAAKRNVQCYSFEETTYGEVADDLYRELTPAERRNVTNFYLGLIARGIGRFVTEGTTYDVHFPVTVRNRIVLDEEGWAELYEILVPAFERILDLKSRSRERLLDRGEEGWEAEVVLLALESPSVT